MELVVGNGTLMDSYYFCSGDICSNTAFCKMTSQRKGLPKEADPDSVCKWIATALV